MTDEREPTSSSDSGSESLGSDSGGGSSESGGGGGSEPGDSGSSQGDWKPQDMGFSETRKSSDEWEHREREGGEKR